MPPDVPVDPEDPDVEPETPRDVPVVPDVVAPRSVDPRVDGPAEAELAPIESDDEEPDLAVPVDEGPTAVEAPLEPDDVDVLDSSEDVDPMLPDKLVPLTAPRLGPTGWQTSEMQVNPETHAALGPQGLLASEPFRQPTARRPRADPKRGAPARLSAHLASALIGEFVMGRIQAPTT